ncbi:ATP-binding protein [Hydrocarboniphaga sp.]|uniref:ATP-binding protein n=1 Tax=Hydrocarboniphaga sp. TaxID=2033016 RepID=UPI003D09DD99
MNDLLTPELLTICDREAIQVPGAIQPHGLLLSLGEPALQLIQISANLAEVAGKPAEVLLGSPLEQLVGQAGVQQLERVLASESLQQRPIYAGRMSIGGLHYDAVAHRHAGQLIVELEPTARRDASSFAAIYPLVRSFVAQLQQTESLQQLCELAAVEMHRITGFGRVLVYRFNDEGDGEVLAEARDQGYSSYLDLRFPASDIPRQARALYLANHIRLIADAHYQPVPLLPPLHPDTGKPTDLSHAALRSVSPVHVQYMKNMGTLASMSISIIVRGRLWGLISCHHASARTVPFEVRTACEHLGQILSLQIEAKEDRAESAHGLELRRSLVGLLAAMAERDNFVDGLTADGDELLRLAAASGAAIVSAGRCQRVGAAPDEDAILALAEWLAASVPNGMYSSNELALDYPQAAQLQPQAAGLLAMSISQLHQHYVMWFRPEVIQTVKWAGNPHKAAIPDAGTAAEVSVLHPRHSFDSWSQTVRGKTLPWRRSEIEVAEELRRAILAIALRRAEELAALNDELRRSNKELEAFSYSVSHDLRAPLRHIVGYADLLKEFEGAQLTERGQRFLNNIDEAAHFAGTLVDDLLSFSQMGRAALRLGWVHMNELVASVIRDLGADTSGRDVQWNIGPLPTVVADSAFLQLALRNLLANAIKYTRTRSPAVISFTSEELADAWAFHVADNGVGFNMNYVNKLFGVFQRLHRMEEFEGTGIGLANVRRIVERHDGRVWARGEIDRGAVFSFTLPKAELSRNPGDTSKTPRQDPPQPAQ